MKYSFNKALSFFATGMVVAGMGVATVHATDEITAGDGTITVTNAQNGKTYTAYKIFEANTEQSNADAVNPGVSGEFGDSRDGAVAYYATKQQVTFFASAEPQLFEFTEAANGKYNVSLYQSDKADPNTKATVAQISTFLNGKSDEELKEVFDYKEAKTEANAADSSVLEIKPVPYGYYYVRTGTGVVASINTATPSVMITDKNQKTTVDKKTNDYPGDKEVSVDQDNSTAFVGEVKTFDIETNIEPGMIKFEVVDTMGTGLELIYPEGKQQKDGVTVTAEGVILTETNYEVSYEDVAGEQTIKVVFKQDFLKNLHNTANITITYQAKVTEAAVSNGKTENTVVVTPGTNNSDVVSDTVKIFLGKADFVKVEKGNVNTKLANAEFEIYTSKDGNEKLSFVKDATTNTYRFAKEGGTGTTFTLVSGKDGSFHITGLPEGEYWLKETKAPAGYNLMVDRQAFKIKVNNKDANGSGNANNSALVKFETANIENAKGGTVLPSTGGMGTTMLYSIGGLMVAGAAVLIVVRKRVNAQ